MRMGKWQEWRPLTKALGKYTILSFSDDFDTVRIIFKQCDSEKSTEIHVVFFSGDEIYQKSNETYRLNLWVYLDETHKDLDRQWSIYKVEHSDYLRFLSEESETITDHLKFGHYSFMDSEWIFDIASPQQPQVDLFVDGELIERSECRWHDAQLNTKISSSTSEEL
jgi:hypothetical protein